MDRKRETERVDLVLSHNTVMGKRVWINGEGVQTEIEREESIDIDIDHRKKEHIITSSPPSAKVACQVVQA